MKSALCPPGKKSLGGGKGHQGVGGHEEVHGHVHGRNEDVKAETLGSCGQMLLSEVGQLAVLTEASCGERGLVEVQIGRVDEVHQTMRLGCWQWRPRGC